MNLLDFIILAVVAVGVVRGYQSGFFRQAGSIFGIVVSFALGVRLMERVGLLVAEKIGAAESMAPIIGFIAVFAGSYFVILIAARVLEQAMGALHLTGINRAAGGAVGGIKMALLLSIGFVGMSYIDLPTDNARTESQLYESVALFVPTAWSYVSDNASSLDELSRRIEREIDERLPEDSAPQ